MRHQTETPERIARTLGHLVPLAGVCYGVLEIAGDLTIGPFPDDGGTPAALAAYYAGHHHTVGLGGTLMAIGGVFLALFGIAIAARVRDNAIIAGTVLVGTVLATASTLDAGATYAMLGRIGGDGTVAPEALQAWHLASGSGTGGGSLVLLLGVAAAAILGRAMPAWIGWTGLLIGVAEMTPFGFHASLVFLLWTAVAGVVLAVRPGRVARREPVEATVPATA